MKHDWNRLPVDFDLAGYWRDVEVKVNDETQAKVNYVSTRLFDNKSYNSALLNGNAEVVLRHYLRCGPEPVMFWDVLASRYIATDPRERLKNRIAAYDVPLEWMLHCVDQYLTGQASLLDLLDANELRLKLSQAA